MDVKVVLDEKKCFPPICKFKILKELPFEKFPLRFLYFTY
jgi:hypothetical protein